MKKYDLTEAVKAIDPSFLSYQEWVEVGMGLKEEGYPFSLWDDWSRRDSRRYHERECERKWDGFHGGGVTGGSIVKMAFDHGWIPPADPKNDREIAWDASIGDADDRMLDPAWVENADVVEPGGDWDPVKDLVTYLSVLFNNEDNVGYVTSSFEKEGRYLPKTGAYDRTAGELIEKLGSCGGDIGAVVGDYNLDAGAWIRFNPFDGHGIKNSNVAEFRYALVESDTLPIEKQNALVRELELPIAALVHSGGKSLHAIVHIDAKDYDEYRKRVEFLYGVCKKNGIDIDGQNKNPSRLSRMPGVTRKGQRQYLVDTNIGKPSWRAWEEWYLSSTDDLPDTESLADIWSDMPELAPELIDGILRQGHKMLIAGPSKIGKTFLLIELAIAIAEGRDWLGHYCEKGKVLYVNLELDRATCLHRFKDVYEALDWEPKHLSNIVHWPLRGNARPMDELAPKLIRRAQKDKYLAIIIDPLYKVITGDENSADQMAKFFNQFDRVCREAGSAMIYCHHHSKGDQGKKLAMDRASGSGVFARDPDALIDVIQLHLKDEAREALGLDEYATAWAFDATLREFRKPKTCYTTFSYPIHTAETTGVLEDAEPESEYLATRARERSQKSGRDKGAKATSDRFAIQRELRLDAVIQAIKELEAEGIPPTRSAIAEIIGTFDGKTVTWRMIKDWHEQWEDNREAKSTIDKENGNVLHVERIKVPY